MSGHRAFAVDEPYNSGIAGRRRGNRVEGARVMASSTQPYGKMLDYEQYIEHQISRTRARIRMTDILTAFLTLVSAALGLLFLEVVLDHAVGLPVWLRRLILFGALAGGGAFAIMR